MTGTGRIEPPDVESSSDDYARRFAGSGGEWFLDVQAEGVLRLLQDRGCSSILEVGGGHAQLAGHLREAGYKVTVQGSTPSCAARIRRLSRAVPFVCSSMDLLPFPDRSFDVVISVRTLAHVPRVQPFLRECSRVAAAGVLVDYPSGRSLNGISGLFLPLKKKLEGDTRPYRVIGPGAIADLFTDLGFQLSATVPQFFWPMVLHRVHRRRSIGRLLEAVPRIVGLTRALGSPVLSLFLRRNRPQRK